RASVVLLRIGVRIVGRDALLEPLEVGLRLRAPLDHLRPRLLVGGKEREQRVEALDDLARLVARLRDPPAARVPSRRFAEEAGAVAQAVERVGLELEADVEAQAGLLGLRALGLPESLHALARRLVRPGARRRERGDGLLPALRRAEREQVPGVAA